MKKRIALISVLCVALLACIVVAIVLIAISVKPHEHEWGPWKGVEGNEPTCLEYGIERRACTGCDEVETRNSPRLGHHFNENNVCTRCDTAVTGTEGLWYETSADKSYVTVIGILPTADVTDVVIPRYVNGVPVDAIDDRAFEEREISSVYISDGIKRIGKSAFSGCALLEECFMSITLETIGDAAFAHCSLLPSIEIAPTAEIGSTAFMECTSLEKIELPDGFTSLGVGAFLDCTALKSVTIGADLAEISANAFEGCTALVEFRSGKGLHSLGSFAFKGCVKLRDVYLDSGFVGKDAVIGGAAFQDCTGLQEFYYSGTKNQWKAMNRAPDWLVGLPASQMVIIHCSDGAITRFDVEVNA